MLPFQQPGDLSFGTDQDENKVEDQIWMQNTAVSTGVGSMNPPNLPSNMNTRGRGRRGRRASASPSADNEQKKIIHREVERQRRQEMSELYSSLRSILPAEYIKGKRSTSDHLAEAANYIKDLEKNVKELGDKRDELKLSIESTSSQRSAGGSSSSDTQCPGTVVMVPRLGGLDIEINVGEDDGFLLSSALQVILEEGIGIASYTSTKVDNRLVHNIACEVI